MICKKCANMFDDSLSSCPECGTEVFLDKKKKADFTLNMTEEELNKLMFPETSEEVTQESTDGEADEENEPFNTMPPEYEAEQNEKEPETAEETQAQEVKAENKKEEAAEQTTEEKPKAKKVKTKMDPESKPAATLIISIMCVLAVMMGLLTFVSVTTDVFEGDDTVRTMALSGLSTEDTGKLEEYLSKVGIISETEYDSRKVTVNELLSMVKPYDANGLYTMLYGTVQKTANIPDPAQRFTNENGDYIYYKIPEEEIDAIVESFCLTVNHTVNGDEYYYYDGNYYFAEKIQYEPLSSYVVDISESKQILDGRYYVTGSILKQSNLSEDNRDRYAIVEKTKSGDWKISRMSDEPLFNKEGVMIKADGELSFTTETEVVEIVADDGSVYHRYILEYPVFSGETSGEKAANRLHNDLISSFATAKENAQKDYEKYLEDGGEKDELPYITHIVSTVTYNSGEYISVIEEISEYIPASVMEKDETEPSTEDIDTQEQQKPVSLPKKQIEGYNFEVETGDFVKKDEFIGKDYKTVSELLYRIYGDYSYGDIIGEETETDGSIYGEQEEIPDDTENIGRKIYESASVRCEEGYLFRYVDEKGVSHDVVIPDEIIEKTLSD